MLRSFYFQALFVFYVQEDVEVKRSFIFALIYGFDNKKIDTVREIPKGQLNARIREIPISELLDHQQDQHKLEKRWRYVLCYSDTK